MPHLLIVDDDVAVAGTLTRMLELRGYQVESAQSAEGGLEMAALHRPDAILVDMRMPSMSGIEFLRHLRRDPRLQETPVAALVQKKPPCFRVGKIQIDLSRGRPPR